MKRAAVAAVFLVGCIASLSTTRPLRPHQAIGADLPPRFRIHAVRPSLAPGRAGGILEGDAIASIAFEKEDEKALAPD